MSLGDTLRDLDRRQQRGRRSSFIAAVIKKFTEDQAAQLAALIAYYAFVSLFPLLQNAEQLRQKLFLALLLPP